MAFWANALDVAVREEPVVLLAVELLVLVLLEPAVLVELQEDALRDPGEAQRSGCKVVGLGWAHALGLLRGGSTSKVVKADLEPLVRLGVQLVVCGDARSAPAHVPARSRLTLVAKLLRSNVLLRSHDLSRRAVLVRAADLRPGNRSAPLRARLLRVCAAHVKHAVVPLPRIPRKDVRRQRRADDVSCEIVAEVS